MCYLLNHLPLTADICLSSKNIGSHSLRVSKWECRICPEAYNSYFLFFCGKFLEKRRKKKSVRNRGVGISCRSEYSTETFFICVRTLTGNFYWQLWACFTLVYCLTINYSTRGAIHICALVKLFFGTGSEQCSGSRYNPEIEDVDFSHSDQIESRLHCTNKTFWRIFFFLIYTYMGEWVIVNFILLHIKPKGKNFLPFKTVGHCQKYFAVFGEKCSRVTYSTQGFFWINFLSFFQATGTHTTHLSRWKMAEESWCFFVFVGSRNQKALCVSLLLSLSPIYSVFLDRSTSSPLLTGAKLLKTPLLKWSTHFTFPLWTWECGLQILCGNVLR